MAFRIIMTVILMLGGAALFLTGTGRMLPLGVKLLPFVETALLWLYLAPKGSKGWLGILLLVQFYIVLFLFVVPAAGGMWTFEYLDRERNLAPITVGNAQGEKTLVVVYHPGGSDFTGRALRELGRALEGTEYKLVMYSARQGLELDLSQAAAVGLASPVYTGQIRPPLKRFIARGLPGAKCFLVLTGGVAAEAEKDLANAASLVEDKGSKVIAAVKFIQNKEEARLKEQAAAFAAQLVAALKKGE